MVHSDTTELSPFGEVSCERELTLLKERYTEYYFDHAPFGDVPLAVELNA
jgi:hypothetical protein